MKRRNSPLFFKFAKKRILLSLIKRTTIRDNKEKITIAKITIMVKTRPKREQLMLLHLSLLLNFNNGITTKVSKEKF